MGGNLIRHQHIGEEQATLGVKARSTSIGVPGSCMSLPPQVQTSLLGFYYCRISSCSLLSWNAGNPPYQRPVERKANFSCRTANKQSHRPQIPEFGQVRSVCQPQALALQCHTINNLARHQPLSGSCTAAAPNSTTPRCGSPIQYAGDLSREVSNNVLARTTGWSGGLDCDWCRCRWEFEFI